MHSILRIHRLSTNARIPTRGSELAAGLDLYSSEDTSIPSFGKKIDKNRFTNRITRRLLRSYCWKIRSSSQS